ncbi:hypothetical protein HHK36_023844 [Tetracentron sinense]|uniref:Bromo domain-containing protein n=1 Tax=Tetracentron sinense TaxID=13715 RepID=A0A834YM26_TETSI|nr:hypothetical protein HHK36_023844 [Tetracentron sinense]
MGKITKKKKGRPSKADLALRAGLDQNPPQRQRENDIRRSLRRRNYSYDFDDYDDEDERREKKLKLVLKLPHKSGFGGIESSPSLTRGDANSVHASAPESAVSASSSEYRDGLERGRNADSKEMGSVPGTPLDYPSGVPLPDNKLLELILDKLQKKDTYGVYAEPVDPEDLPDYQDVIENPMDFGTVRKKLANGAYSNLEQFEGDIFLICTNAMQYNAPETIYFKQARSIQELARKKFERLRGDIECTETVLKSEFRTTPNSLVKKPTKKSSCRIVQEPVGSDFSSGATLATTVDTCTLSNTIQAGGSEKPRNLEWLVDGNSSLTDNKSEKAEEHLSGVSGWFQQIHRLTWMIPYLSYDMVFHRKGFPLKSGRKPCMFDENRRATYNISNEPVVRTESTFALFEGENKQLVAVGLNADHSYARSLALFAATLGPVAWKVASRRIEQALPVGFKFGRGWVGEYEPLPTPVLMLENHTLKQPAYGPNLQCTAESRKDGKAAEGSQHLNLRTRNSLEVTECSVTPNPATEHPVGGPTLERKLGLFGFAGKPVVNAMYQQQNPLTMNFSKSDDNVSDQGRLNCSPSANGNLINVVQQKQVNNSSEMTTSRLLEMVSRNRNVVQSVPFKQQETNGIVAVNLPNGKTMSSGLDSNRVCSSSSDFISNQRSRAVNYFPHGNQEQGLSDPVQLMRMLAEKSQNQMKSSNNSMVDNTPQVMPSVPSSRRDDSSTAATAAARAWMSIGSTGFQPTESSSPPKVHSAAAALYNPAQELPQQILRFHEEPPVSGAQLQSEKYRFPPQAFLPQAFQGGNEARFQNKPMVFPQLVTADLSRFQVQSPWRGLSPRTQPRQNQETLPPDLNIGFQSSESPVRQSSGIMVDSQQPDLALQL